jgi:hypothetical protein
VEEIIEKLRIEAIRPQLKLCRTACASLAGELKNPRLTFIERAVIAAERHQMLKKRETLASSLDQLRRRKRDGCA